MNKPFTLKLKSLGVLEDDSTVFRGSMFNIGLLGLAFGKVEVLNLNTLRITYKDVVNKIRLDEQIGYDHNFAEVMLEDLQARLRVRFGELLVGGQKILERASKFDDYRQAFERENNYVSPGIQIMFRKIMENDDPVMQCILKTDFGGLELKTTNHNEFLVALGSSARAFTRNTYRQYGMPDARWNHHTNAPVNPAEHNAEFKTEEPEGFVPELIEETTGDQKTTVGVLGGPSFNPGLAVAAMSANSELTSDPK